MKRQLNQLRILYNESETLREWSSKHASFQSLKICQIIARVFLSFPTILILHRAKSKYFNGKLIAELIVENTILFSEKIL